MVNTDTDDSRQERRRKRLEQFIADHAWLAENRRRRAAFILGVLVGRVSQYQSAKNRSSTAIKNHPIGNLTKHNFDRTVTRVLDRITVYSGEEDLAGLMHNETVQILVNTTQHESASNWDLRTEDIRNHYATGVAYGMDDRARADADAEADGTGAETGTGDAGEAGVEGNDGDEDESGTDRTDTDIDTATT